MQLYLELSLNSVPLFQCYVALLLGALLVRHMSWAVPVDERRESNPADPRENLDTAETLFGWGGPWGPSPFGPYGGFGGFWG